MREKGRERERGGGGGGRRGEAQGAQARLGGLKATPREAPLALF